jgi:hypothetical protein
MKFSLFKKWPSKSSKNNKNDGNQVPKSGSFTSSLSSSKDQEADNASLQNNQEESFYANKSTTKQNSNLLCFDNYAYGMGTCTCGLGKIT